MEWKIFEIFTLCSDTDTKILPYFYFPFFYIRHISSTLLQRIPTEKTADYPMSYEEYGFPSHLFLSIETKFQFVYRCVHFQMLKCVLPHLCCNTMDFCAPHGILIWNPIPLKQCTESSSRQHINIIIFDTCKTKSVDEPSNSPKKELTKSSALTETISLHTATMWVYEKKKE